ncbi:uncharacterized protein AMSG_05632 [Thecamonas trahens ATCC 50062]|uniref:Uncharacterized protein n=1 Tax=Thecamonas trahens ATCC 50062 TaxID=461836 RepID=A0A0L0DB94_THETB|nr:hypothetical protein AMSG_05632 [Thecamonas trahens ATCC 50062]KNC49592.1 hypothetical protein AMSG_05632 [Thecamonas trahens ATCC 50062]|eukprot:XP_013757700.1 hypothetical protein AMSG_05632 [Thecamonas trahens ATCC 50062]
MSVADLGVPLYAVVRTTGNMVFAAGGGGGSATGVPNTIAACSLSSSGRISLDSLTSTHPHAVMTLAAAPTAGVLLAAEEEAIGVYDIAHLLPKGTLAGAPARAAAAPAAAAPAASSPSTSKASSASASTSTEPATAASGASDESDAPKNASDGDDAAPGTALGLTKIAEWKADLSKDEPRVRKVVVADAARLVATTGSEGRIRVWKLEHPEYTRVHTLTGHTGVVRDLAFNMYASRIASVSQQDGTLKIWNVSMGSLIRSVAVETVAAAIEGALDSGPMSAVRSAVGGSPGRAKAGSKSRLSFRTVFYNRSSNRQCLILGLTGKIAGASEPSSHVAVIDAETGAVVTTLKVADEPMTAMAYADDGSLLGIATGERVYIVQVSASPSGLLRLAHFVSVTPHPLLVTSLAFSSNNSHVLTVSVDRTLVATRITGSSRSLFLVIALFLATAALYYYFVLA